jgi:diguanylate cyclase (GGDEF)-like protein
VRTIISAGELVTSAMRLIGTHPVGLSFALTDEARHGITKGILEKADGGLYQASFGKLSKELCHQIEFIAGIDGVYGVGFARKGGIFGDAIIFTRKGKELPDLSVIEAFVNQASVALHHRKAEEELRALSLVDELTGLYNRRGFLTLAEQQVKIANRAQRGLLLLFADLDRLKWINDTLGHAEGDRAIQEAAAIMKHCFRESDIVARLGGDEFAVLAVEAGDAPPELFTTRLQQCLDAHNASASLRYALSLSVGVVTYDPNHPCPIDELLTRADALMYDQKRNKKRVARPA